MHRAHHGGGGTDAAAAAAVAATVAPLLQPRRAAQKANKLARPARAVELYERALAAAELAQPRNSLIIAALLGALVDTHIRALQAHPITSTAAERMQLTLRSLHLLHARWQAGTLFSPTAEEVAFLEEDDYPFLPAQLCGAFFYTVAAVDVVLQQARLPCAPAEAEALLHATYGALRAALETDARNMLERHPRTGQAWPASSTDSAVTVSCLKMAVHDLVAAALSDEAGMMLGMRATCGLTAAEETALRRVAERHKAEYQRNEQELPKRLESLNTMHQQAAAADAARHGLRRCVLPSCDAQEAHPKLFKLCGRCRGVAYCCAQHSKDDWKRHKREDGCHAAP